MKPGKTHAVTGAFGYSGKYIAQRLRAQGKAVITLTNSRQRASVLADSIPAYPLAFEEPGRLEESLKGVEVLYNTYWVRFNHRLFTHEQAVKNTVVLFEAAKRAGVRRIVHVSITNPREDSPLEYFAGKARLETALKGLGISYAILRPTVLFGNEDILINNIAWGLRRFPFFVIFGDGSYRLQPIHVDDLAELAVREGDRTGNVVINAIGPETFTYRELVAAVARAIDRPCRLVATAPEMGYWLGKVIGWTKRDTFITREEIKGLMDGLLYVSTAPTGRTALTRWMAEHAASLGRNYASELKRRRDRVAAYAG